MFSKSTFSVFCIAYSKTSPFLPWFWLHFEITRSTSLHQSNRFRYKSSSILRQELCDIHVQFIILLSYHMAPSQVYIPTKNTCSFCLFQCYYLLFIISKSRYTLSCPNCKRPKERVKFRISQQKYDIICWHICILQVMVQALWLLLNLHSKPWPPKPALLIKISISQLFSLQILYICNAASAFDKSTAMVSALIWYWPITCFFCASSLVWFLPTRIRSPSFSAWIWYSIHQNIHGILNCRLCLCSVM